MGFIPFAWGILRGLSSCEGLDDIFVLIFFTRFCFRGMAAFCVVCRCPAGIARFASPNCVLNRCGSSVVEFLRQHHVPCVEAEGATSSFVCEECLGMVVRCDEMYFCYVMEIEGLRRKVFSAEAKPVVDLKLFLVDRREEVQAALPTADDLSSPPCVPLQDYREDCPEISTSACFDAMEQFRSTSLSSAAKDARGPPRPCEVGFSDPLADGITNPEAERTPEQDQIAVDPGAGQKRKEEEGEANDGPMKEVTRKLKVCPVCFERFEPGTYVRHFQTAHPEHKFKRAVPDEPYRCSLCPYFTLFKKSLKNHIFAKHGIGEKKHCEKKHVCSECGAAFKVATSLTGHMVKAHGAKKKFACEQCGKSYVGRPGLDRHMMTEHDENPAKTVCPECGEEVLVALYASHVGAKHREKKVRQFVCDLCGGEYATRKGLSRHLGIAHKIGGWRGEVPKKCEECGRVIKSVEYFNLHMLREHGIEVPGLRKLKCPTCEEIFYIRKFFEAHKMLHTGKYKHVCKECGYSTRFSGNFFKHMKLVHKNSVSAEK